jgi:hypothetical protein
MQRIHNDFTQLVGEGHNFSFVFPAQAGIHFYDGHRPSPVTG